MLAHKSSRNFSWIRLIYALYEPRGHLKAMQFHPNTHMHTHTLTKHESIPIRLYRSSILYGMDQSLTLFSVWDLVCVSVENSGRYLALSEIDFVSVAFSRLIPAHRIYICIHWHARSILVKCWHIHRHSHSHWHTALPRWCLLAFAFIIK